MNPANVYHLSACLQGDMHVIRTAGDALSGIHALMHRSDLSSVERIGLVACLDLVRASLDERAGFVENRMDELGVSEGGEE